MSTFDWPATMLPQTCAIGSKGAQAQFTSPYNGSTQVVSFVAERLVLSLAMPARRTANAGAVEALIFKLRGGVNRVRCWHFARPQPVGTMRGTPTLATTVNRGDSVLVINTTVGATLKAGDMLGLGSHLLQVADDATAVGTVITVNLLHRVRETVAAGAAITWDKPTAQFMMPADSAAITYRPMMAEGVALDLVEVW